MFSRLKYKVFHWLLAEHRRKYRSVRHLHINEALLKAALNGLGILNYQSFEETGEQHLLTRLLGEAPEGATVCDVGANIGNYSRSCLGINPALDVHAFEPHPESFGKLAALAGELGFRAINQGCSSETGEAELFDYSENQGSSHASLHAEVIENIHQADSAPRTIQLTTLDQYCASQGIEHIHLLKVDTEGHELAVLQGAEGLIARGAIEHLQFEFNEMNLVSRSFLKDFRAALPGYRFYRLLPDGLLSLDDYSSHQSYLTEIFAFQNILASRRELPPGS